VYSLAPGETLPYDFNSWGPLNYNVETYDLATNYVVQVDWNWTWNTSTDLIDLTTTDDVNSFDSYEGTFSGLVVNNTGGDISSVTIIVSLYDEVTGVLIATDYDWIFDDIADGASAEYTVYVSTPEGFDPETAIFDIIVKGERP
jgi:hypothetical protein